MSAVYRVTDRDGTVIWPRFLARSNAELEAAVLNVSGLREFAPYRVEAYEDPS